MKTRAFIGTFLFLSLPYLSNAQDAKSYTKSNVNNFSGFIENKGQIFDQNNRSNPAVLYLLNTPGFNVQLRKIGFSYDLYRISPPAGRAGNIDQRILNDELVNNDLPFRPSSIQHPVSSIQYHRIDFDMEGMNPDYKIETSEPSADYLNYYTSGTPVKGVTGVRYYKTITYKNIYHGIDLEFIMIPEQGYKYNFVVHPEGTVGDIKLNINGPDHIQFTRDTLKFTTRLGVVDELIPESYFLNDDSRTLIKSHFVELGDGVYGFSVDGDIPEASTLVIDPTSIRSWGTYFGGPGNDNGYNVSVDNEHNVILASNTWSSTNIATTGAYDTIKNIFYDMYIAKFTASGVRLWGTYYGGDGDDELYGAKTDMIGNIYVTGGTCSNSYIASPGSFQDTCSSYNNLGPEAGYLAKFSPNGWRIWGTYYGGSSTDQSFDVDVDKNGNVYIVGSTGGSPNLGTPGTYQPDYYSPYPYGGDGFIAKFDSSGARIWGTYYGCGCLLSGISIDTSGILYAAGATRSPDTIASSGAYQTVYGGEGDAFLVAFTLTGQRIWGTYYGGPLQDGDWVGGSYPNMRCKVDNNGAVYLTGFTASTSGIASPGSHQQTYGGGYQDGFIAKFNSLGQRIWGTYYGGAVNEQVHSCSPGWNGDVFFTGMTNSADGIATAGSYMPIKNGGYDAFLVKFNTAGQRQWGTYFGGPANDNGFSSGYVVDDTIYFSGNTISTTNIASGGAHQVTFSGGSDAFLEKFIECWPIAPAQPITGATSVCQSSSGLAYSTDTLAHAMSFEWTLPPGATITSGSETTHITVDFGSSATSGFIKVTGLNKCKDPGDSASLFITVHPRPVPVISGPDTTCTGDGKVYSTAPGKTNYEWSVSPGGTIISGGTTTDSIATILWTSVGPQWIRLSYTDSSGCTALNPSQFDVMVYQGTTLTNDPLSKYICSGDSTRILLTATEPGTTFSWTATGSSINVSGYSGGSGDRINQKLVNTGSIPETVTYSITPAINGCLGLTKDYIVTVNPILTVSISVTASANPVCSGTSVTFTATPVNGGTTPQYQWKVNGANVGGNSPIYTYVPTDGDLIWCVLTSSEPCTSSNPASSIQLLMAVNSNLPVGISISVSVNPVCEGIQVTFTATPTNGGSSPHFQWKVNGSDAGMDNSTFTYTPNNNDFVTCTLTSSLPCTSNNPAISNTASMSIATAPVIALTHCFDSITRINAKPIKLKGGIPLGGTYSGPGVNSTTGVFTPSAAGTGTKTITYSYTNFTLCSASKTKTIIVRPAAAFICGNNLIDIRDNKVYPTVQIGSQCWMAVDLNYGQEISPSQHQRDNCIPEKYFNPGSSIQHPASSYQWDELMLYDNIPGLQGLCPPGWHVPSETEWQTLFSNWTNNAFAGAPLKYSGYSGFDALLSGVRHMNVQWNYQNFAIFYWSSTPYSTYKAWAHGMNDYDPGVAAYPALRSNAFSVRCLKD